MDETDETDEMPARLDDLITFVRSRRPGGGPLEHLSTAVLTSERLGAIADDLIGHFVDQARQAGASWTDIGQSMGVSKQAAQKRFVARRPEPAPASGASGLWSKFTDDARAVVLRAVEEAREAGHRKVETEHLALAITRVPASLAACAVQDQGIGLDALREAVTATLAPPRETIAGHIPFADRTKKVLELALREAILLGRTHIGTEHLLLGLLREAKGTGGRVLLSLGVTRDATEEWLASPEQ
jgi:Clp amino terminal domain, pathogenicity island component